MFLAPINLKSSEHRLVELRTWEEKNIKKKKNPESPIVAIDQDAHWALAGTMFDHSLFLEMLEVLSLFSVGDMEQLTGV
jgi:hypothetical protein